jgi:hypothetical protein
VGAEKIYLVRKCAVALGFCEVDFGSRKYSLHCVALMGHGWGMHSSSGLAETVVPGVMIRGSLYCVGDELTIAYATGTQKVRIAEITRTGRVRLDRCYAGHDWRADSTLYNPSVDRRFGPL